MAEGLPSEFPARDDRLELFDNFLVGPCAREFGRHAARRREYWASNGASAPGQSYEEVHDRLSHASAIAIWSTDTWAGRLASAFVCAHAPESALVELHEFSWVGDRSDVRCGCVRSSARGEHAIEKLDATMRARGAEVWRLFASSEPRDVLGACSSPWMPNAGGLRQLVANLFPRRRRRVLRLSALDEALFRGASDPEGTSAAEFLGPTDRELIPAARWARCGGDWFIAARLAAWSSHPFGGPALRVRDAARTPVLTRYELTDDGRAWLAGLPDVALAPPLPIGGSCAYSRDEFFGSGDTEGW